MDHQHGKGTLNGQGEGGEGGEESEGGVGGEGGGGMGSHLGMEFGEEDSFLGVYRIIPFREKNMLEFWRGSMGQGVRGFIDPLDPDNKYGPKTKEELEIFKQSERGELKTLSGITVATAHTANLSQNYNSDNSDNLGEDHPDIDMTVNPLFQRTSKNIFAFICTSKKAKPITHFEVAPNSQKLLYDEAVEAMEGFCSGVDLT
jgi:hypothetical protein